MSTPAPTTPTPASRGGSASTANSIAPGKGPESMTDLEREVLEEYGQLLTNLNELAPLIADLATNPTAQVLDTLRVLERKASLVGTLLKASVYSIVLQQQMLEGEGEGEGDGSGGEHGGVNGHGADGLGDESWEG